jgi:hypothetical protein
MKSIAKWIHNNQFRIDNDRDFIISVADPCVTTSTEEPNSWELISMGFSGCIASGFVKTATKNRLYFTDLEVELIMNTCDVKQVVSIDVILRINTTANVELIYHYFEDAIKNSPLGILMSGRAIPININVKYLNHVKAEA